MVTRRKFLGMLAVLPAITALAGSGLRLPRREDVEVVDVNPYLTSNTAWYLKTEPEGGLKYFHRYGHNTVSEAVELSERSLEDILKQMLDSDHMLTYPRPMKLFVPPRLAMSAHHVLTHRPTLLERLLWRLFPVD
jgi:hypothetical protein